MARIKFSVAIILTAAVAAIAPVVAQPSSNPGGGNTPASATSTHSESNMPTHWRSGSISATTLEDATHYHITNPPRSIATVNVYGHRNFESANPDFEIEDSPHEFNVNIHTKAGDRRSKTHVHLHNPPYLVHLFGPNDELEKSAHVYSHYYHADGSITDHIEQAGTHEGSHYHLHMYGA